MDAAKASVKKIIGKDGKHDTTVHEQVAPAVERENVTQTQHEKFIPAVDREVHQTHYHTTEQPVLHKETLPEQHHHQEMPMETRRFDHSKGDDIKRSLDAERSQYVDAHQRVEGQKTHSTEAAIAGEHVHHHVHETIQPIINKETVEPHVVHKTVPIHEVHHNEAQHHSAHSLPPVSMEEFKTQGGSLRGREERQDFFQGEPKAFPGSGGSHGTSGLTGSGTHGTSGLTGSGTHGTSGLTGSGTHGTSGLTGSNTHGTSGLTGSNTHGTSNLTGTSGSSTLPTGTTGSSGLSNTTGTTTSTTTSTNTGAASKPGLMDKLNPKKDTDGDGQAGFMK